MKLRHKMMVKRSSADSLRKPKEGRKQHAIRISTTRNNKNGSLLRAAFFHDSKKLYTGFVCDYKIVPAEKRFSLA
jgi:hypothetical protein